MFGCFARAFDGLGLEVPPRTARNVIEDLRDVHRVGDRGIVGVQAVLSRPVVIRRHEEGGVGPGLEGEFREADGLARGVRAGPGHHLGPSGDPGDDEFDDPLVLLVRERRAFSRRAHRADGPRALGDLPVDRAAELLVIDLAPRGTA